MKGESEQPEFVYLIKSGRCILVREMKIIKRTLPFGKEKLILPLQSNQTMAPRLNRLKKDESLIKYFLGIGNLQKGDYFGIGENIKDSFIITKGKVRKMFAGILYIYDGQMNWI